MRTIVAAALVAACVTPALADFYIVQNPTTKRCTIVEQRPANPTLGIVVGDRGFGVRLEAENHLKTVEVCQESTIGERERGGVIIEERS